MITSTGLTEGQLIGLSSRIFPTATDDTGVQYIAALIGGRGRMQTVESVAKDGLLVTPGVQYNNMDVDLTVRAYDAARNYGEVTTRVHVDAVAPTATFTPKSVKLSGTTTITASDVSDDVTEIVMSRNGQEISRATAAPWVFGWNTRATDPDYDGYPQIKFTIRDRAGNVTEVFKKYHVDNRGPKIEDVTSLVGRGRSTLRAWVSDQGGVARVEWWVDGARRGEGWEFAYDFGTRSRVAPLTVKAWDKFGNLTAVSQNVVVDATAPAVTWISPASGALVRGDRIATSIKASDSAGWLHAGLAGGYVNSEPPVDATSGKLTGVRYVKADGRYTLTWNVYDRVGNRTTVSRTVIVDNTRAKLTVTKAPKNKAKVKGTVKITAAASDKNGVAKVQLLVNGKVVATDAKAAYKFSLNTKKYGKKIKVQLRAYDRAGNVTTTSTRTWYRR
ncbi:Ig-like domain-containing protein [Actinoplanes missouriensis]|uniref:Ig-like domain-containing protein n=1 Tax=Actinoplanes missouriensis TaxID=1866 RepID=UPI0012F9FE2F|nr:Ig-like domain-containing protein [Actinoplanes missouriensis]